jgi:hypothetical protein
LLTPCKGDKKTYTLQTDGANFNSVLKYRSLFNENKIDCNDIGAVLAKYGVECARAAIIEQTDAVFQVYGINVSPRHLMLIADYMTFDGKSSLSCFEKFSWGALLSLDHWGLVSICLCPLASYAPCRRLQAIQPYWLVSELEPVPEDEL